MRFELRSGMGLAIVAAVGCSTGLAQPAPESDEPPSSAESAELQPPPSGTDLVRHRCRIFPTEPDDTVDTWDRSTELGQWTLAQQESGWRVDSIDMAVGQKPTGFVQTYTQICLVPREGQAGG